MSDRLVLEVWLAGVCWQGDRTAGSTTSLSLFTPRERGFSPHSNSSSVPSSSFQQGIGRVDTMLARGIPAGSNKKIGAAIMHMYDFLAVHATPRLKTGLHSQGTDKINTAWPLEVG